MGVLSQYYTNPGLMYCLLIVQVFCYLSGTLNLGIIFQADSSDKLVGYINFNYTSFIDDQKSVRRYIFMLLGKLLSHQLKLQNTIALFSTKANYMATGKAGKKAL